VRRNSRTFRWELVEDAPKRAAGIGSSTRKM
jgi:hypothetical protein